MFKSYQNLLFLLLICSSSLWACESIPVEVEELTADSHLSQISNIYQDQCTDAVLAVGQYEDLGVKLAIKTGSQLSIRYVDDGGNSNEQAYPDTGIDFSSVHFLDDGKILLENLTGNQLLLWNEDTSSWDDFLVAANLPQGQLTELMVLDGFVYLSIDEGVDKGIWLLNDEGVFTQLSVLPASEAKVARSNNGLVQVLRLETGYDYRIEWLEDTVDAIEFYSSYGIVEFEAYSQENEILLVVTTSARSNPVKVFLNRYVDISAEDDPVSFYEWQGDEVNLPTQIYEFKGCQDSTGTIYCTGITKRDYALGVYTISGRIFRADTNIYRQSFITDEVLDELLKIQLEDSFKQLKFFQWREEFVDEGNSQEPPLEYTEVEIQTELDRRWKEITQQEIDDYYDRNYSEELRDEKGGQEMLNLSNIFVYAAGASRYVAAEHVGRSVLVESQSSNIFTHLVGAVGEPKMLVSGSGQYFYWYGVTSAGYVSTIYENQIFGDLEVRSVLLDPFFGEDEEENGEGVPHNLPRAELSGSFSLFVVINMLLLLTYRKRSLRFHL